MKKNTEYHVLGVMSGTSLDGLDLAICSFKKKNQWNFKIKKTTTISYSSSLTIKLKELHTQSKDEINKTNIEYGEFIGNTINSFITFALA